MKALLFTLTLLLFSVQTGITWGKTGHRITGLIAEKHLTKKARKNIERVLGNESLAEVSNYMDFIKSERKYDFMGPWHYCTIPDGQTYEQAGTPEEGDVIQTIERLITELKTRNFTDQDEAFALKMLVHLIGDIHQPLHVGNGNDRGGNDIKVKYFGRDSNLHRVWDSQMIDGEQLSYTEYTRMINFASEEQITEWQSASVRDWAKESMSYREQIYAFPEDGRIFYRYIYDNIDLVNQRLLQAGVRMAGVLNEIYG